ncbi:MAG: SDR family NAD(P)-dependent oxidoreductase [Deltaproteobacteria bacterium]|nr:SDR family NAD(P)-dependent oxidoreductase [Deltaproteobacteria bacterium]
MDLKSKCAVVTGGAMGIGLATAKRLIAEGCQVTLWDLNGPALEDAKKALENLGGQVFAHVCDVTDKARVYELARQAVADMGKVDILVNNAGYVMGGDFIEQPDEVWEKTIAVNLTSFIYTIKAFLPGMYERDCGHVVNISSASALVGVPDLAMYCATKWAVWGLTESLRFEAWERDKKGVRWSSIHPCYIAKGMFEGAKLRGISNLLAPLLKDHDVVAEAIVESALKRGRYSPKRPRTLRSMVLLRGLVPDELYQWLLDLLGVTGSMKHWVGRKGK